MDADELLAYDRAHVWHPYGPMPSAGTPYLVRSASGVRLRLADGWGLVDGRSSWWAAIHGYWQAVWDAALAEPAAARTPVMFGGPSHETAIRLARTRVPVPPAGRERVLR